MKDENQRKHLSAHFPHTVLIEIHIELQRVTKEYIETNLKKNKKKLANVDC